MTTENIKFILQTIGICGGFFIALKFLKIKSVRYRIITMFPLCILLYGQIIDLTENFVAYKHYFWFVFEYGLYLSFYHLIKHYKA